MAPPLVQPTTHPYVRTTVPRRLVPKTTSISRIRPSRTRYIPPRYTSNTSHAIGQGPAHDVTTSKYKSQLSHTNPRDARRTVSRPSCLKQRWKMAVLCGMPTIQYSARSPRQYLIPGSLAHSSPQRKRHLDRFSRLCRAH